MGINSWLRSRSRPGLGRRSRGVGIGVTTFVASMAVLASLIKVSQGGLHGPTQAIAIALVILVVVISGAHRAGFGSVLLGALFAPMVTLGPIPAASLWTLADVFLVIGFVLLIPQMLGGRLELPPLFVGGAILLVMAGLVASTFSAQPFRSLGEMLRLVAAGVLLPTAFLLWNPSRRKIVAVAAAYVCGSAISSLYGPTIGGKTADGRYAGLSEHPNGLGLTAMFSVALVPFLFAASSRERRWIWLTLGAVNAVGVWISGSRAALLVLLVLIVLFPLVSRSAVGLGLVGFGTALSLLFSDRLLNAEGGNALSRLLGGGSSSDSNAEREDRIGTVMGSIREHPLLGSGFIHTWFAHVTYLEIMAAAGLFGLIGFCAILISADRNVLFSPRPYNLLAYPALGYTMVGFVTNVIWERYIWIPLSLSLLAWIHSRPDGDRAIAPSTHPMEVVP
ncbi:MAG TPA: hypothetical protein VMZ66_05685 [Aeromicrobium sp.]|nr:hypothetical protein [Aeromicrobium sp.]